MRSNKICFFCVLSVFLLILGSCASTQVFDDSVPESEQAYVNFGTMKVTSYNGIAVNWSKAKFPAGNTVIGGNVDIYRGGIIFKCSGMEFSFLFEGGKEYYIVGATQDMKWGVNIYDKLPVSILGSEPEGLIEFIPFATQPVF